METEALPATGRTARFPLGHTVQQPSQPRTDSVRRTDLGTGAWAGDFPGNSLRARCPLSPGNCPGRPLPRRTLASSNNHPSASTGLKHLGPVCVHLAYKEATPQTPPPRPYHCKDPPVLPCVKGTPFPLGRTWGGPQEMVFLRSAAICFLAKSWAAHGHSCSSSTSLPGVT